MITVIPAAAPLASPANTNKPASAFHARVFSLPTHPVGNLDFKVISVVGTEVSPLCKHRASTSNDGVELVNTCRSVEVVSFQF